MFCHRTRTPTSAAVLIQSFWFVRFTKLQIMQTSMGIDARNNLRFCCYNPCCGGQECLFECSWASSLHLARSPYWKQFACECDRKRNAHKYHWCMQIWLFRAANSHRRFVETSLLMQYTARALSVVSSSILPLLVSSTTIQWPCIVLGYTGRLAIKQYSVTIHHWSCTTVQPYKQVITYK